MKTYEDLIRRWDACKGGQLLVDHRHPIRNMYLNINDNGNRELLIPVSHPIDQFKPTEAIGISNYKSKASFFFAIELLSELLLVEYACLCFDLIQSSQSCSTQQEALDTLFATFRKWYILMADIRLDVLPLHEVRGLMGELNYMLEEMAQGKSDEKIVNAWTIQKDAARDFIFDDTWCEVKTIRSSSDYITISSAEQLDHDSDGHITVYRMDQISKEGTSTYTLNTIVREIRSRIGVTTEAIFNRKLLAKGYTFNHHYDEYVFDFKEKLTYLVDSSFPYISRASLPSAVKGVKYELYLSRLNEWRVSYG